MKNKSKLKLWFVILFTSVILTFNTNTNSIPLINRILLPIKRGATITYYGNLLILLIIYISLYNISKLKKYKLLNGKINCLVGMIVILIVASKINAPIVKIIKANESGLKAIYYHRKDLNNMLVFEKKQNTKEVSLKSKIILENLSDKEVEFNLAIELPQGNKDLVKEKILVSDEIYKLQGKERKGILGKFTGHTNESITYIKGGTERFKFILYNDSEKIEFTPNY